MTNHDPAEITMAYVQDVRERVGQTASLLANNKKINQVMENNWSADLRSNTIFWRADAPYAPGKRLSDDDILFLVAHEAGHLMHSGEYNVRVPQGRVQDFHLFCNAAEDIRMERLLSKEFPGFKPVQEKVYRNAMPMHDRIESYSFGFQFGLHKLAEWANCVDVLPKLDPAVSDLLVKLGAEYDQIVLNAPNIQKLAEGLLPIYLQILQNQIDEAHADRGQDQPGAGEGQDAQGQDSDGQDGQQGQGQGQGEGQGEGQDQDGKNGQQSEPGKGKGATGDAVSKMPTQSAKGSSSEASQFDAQNRMNSIQERLADAHDAMSKKPGGRDPGLAKKIDSLMKDFRVEHDRTVKDRFDGQQVESQQQQLVKVEKSTERRSHTELQSGAFDAANKHAGAANALAHQLKAKLVNNAADYWDTSKKRGRLNPRAAHRIERGDYRIFRTRTQVGTIDYVVGMLVDTSGSMREGSLCFRAAEVTTLLVDALEKVSIPHFVIPYSGQIETSRCLLIGDKRARYGDALVQSILSPGGGTFEGSALDAAYAEFSKIRDSKKILFCLTDGQTASIPTSVELIEKLQKSGVICIGVGLNMDPPKHFPKGIRVNNGADLIVDLPRLLNQLIRSGH